MGEEVEPDPERTYSEADLIAHIRDREEVVIRSRYERLLAVRNHDVDFINLKKSMAVSNLRPCDYCRQHLGMSCDRLKQCARLAENWIEVRVAHFWFESVGRALGWACMKESGVAYGFEVLGLHLLLITGIGHAGGKARQSP